MPALRDGDFVAEAAKMGQGMQVWLQTMWFLARSSSADTVILDEDVEYNGQTYAAGSYEFVNDGRYWTGFDRENPIEGPAREQIWTGTAHALIAELGVGSVTASALQIGLGVAALLVGFGGTILLTGLGLVWATRAATERVKAPVLRPAPTLA